MKYKDLFSTRKKLFMMAFCAILVLVPVTCKNQETTRAELGQKAPQFSLKDLDGNTVSLSDYAGNVVVLDFWATWCHSCKEAAPVLERLYQRYKESGLVLLGISLDSGFGAEENVKTFVRKNKQTYPILRGDDRTRKAYGITSIPDTYILSRDHIVTDRLTGFLPDFETKMDTQISKQLSEAMTGGKLP